MRTSFCSTSVALLFRYLWGIISFFSVSNKNFIGARYQKSSHGFNFAGSAALNKGWEQRSFLALGLITYSLSLSYCMHLSAAAQMCWLELQRERQYSVLLLILVHLYCPNSFWNKCFSLFFIPFESVHLNISSEQSRKSLLPFRGCMLPSSS